MSDLQENIEELSELEPDSSHLGMPEAEDILVTEKFLIFSIMGKLYSFQSKNIGEIALFDSVYPLPLMPSFVLGVVNRYSVPYALFDIGILFHNTPTPKNKVLIVKDEIDRIAFLIEDVNGIADIQLEKIILKDGGIESNDLAEAVSAFFEWNGSTVFVLDIQKILSRIPGGAS